MPVGFLLAGRAGDGIAGEAAIVEGEKVGVADLLPVGALLCEGVAFRLVIEAYLRPLLRPMIAIQVLEPCHDFFDVIAADRLERTVVRGAAQDFFLDFVERALAGLRRRIHENPLS